VVITHDPAIAARMPRQITMLDGCITADTAIGGTIGGQPRGPARPTGRSARQERHQ
jgi:ABC-type lipoprotein export system ATPase subunit